MRIDVWTLLSTGTTSSTSALAFAGGSACKPPKFRCPGIEGAKAAVGKTAAAEAVETKAPQRSEVVRIAA